MNSKLIVSLFAISSMAGIGCGGGGGGKVDQGVGGGNNKTQYCSNVVTLPTGPTKQAIDLNGDGQPDNRLGQIVSVLTAGKIMAQTGAVDPSVVNGSLVMLLEEDSTDATQQSAKAATVKYAYAEPPTGDADAGTQMKPKYDGNDVFTAVSTGQATFEGDISGGTFKSADPVKATTPITYQFNLPLVAGQPALVLPLTAGYIQFTAMSNDIMVGQIDGAVKGTDVTNSIIPAVAAALTAQIKADPSNTQLASFDLNHDGTVTAAEIMANTTLSAFLKPDIQLFDPSTGAYKPNSDPSAVPDSLSVGLGFTAVKATWH